MDKRTGKKKKQEKKPKVNESTSLFERPPIVLPKQTSTSQKK